MLTYYGYVFLIIGEPYNIPILELGGEQKYSIKTS
jgi:hypothetical protein